MADATVAMTVSAFPNGVDTTTRSVIIRGTAAITANGGTSPATGLPLNWAKLINGQFGSGTFIVPNVGPKQTAAGPVRATFTTSGGATKTQLYTYDTTSNSLVVWAAGAAVETGIVADTVNFEAEFIKGKF